MRFGGFSTRCPAATQAGSRHVARVNWSHAPEMERVPGAPWEWQRGSCLSMDPNGTIVGAFRRPW